jgi:uncharacterized membrane protein
MPGTTQTPLTDTARFATEKYLDQVKLLTTLATALLVSPSVLLAVVRFSTEAPSLVADIARASTYLMISSGSFVLVVIATYFIYSSIVGSLLKNKVDLYRPATRWFSLGQLLFVVVGCVFLVLFILQLLRPVSE